MSKLKLTYLDFHGGCGEPTRISVVRMGFEGKGGLSCRNLATWVVLTCAEASSADDMGVGDFLPRCKRSEAGPRPGSETRI
jgi:hypothetical protein